MAASWSCFSSRASAMSNRAGTNAALSWSTALERASDASTFPAQALLRAGKVEASLARSSAVDQDSAAFVPARLLMAEALELKHDHDAAIEIWQSYLAESRHPAGWIQ